MKCIFNGEIVDSSQVALPINDLAVLRGYGIFDFFRLSDGVPLFIDDHLDRFYKSAQIARLSINQSQDVLKALIIELTKVNQMPVSGIRLVLTGGTGAGAYAIGEPNLIVTQEPIKFPADAMYTKGVKLITHEYLRDIPEVKTINYMTGIWLQQKIDEAQAFDVLYHYKGLVHELTRSNVFIINSEHQIITPGEQVLLGVTRKHLLAALKGEFHVEERKVTLEELRTAKEIFITGTTKKVLPICQIDEVIYEIGEVTRKAQTLFQTLEQKYIGSH
tara:strand:+ start:62 stop:886 length:825 start_codon:yes stop_codon:yes gene_type:complete